MSTTFETFPVKTSEVTFGQVIKTSERHINNYLSSIGVPKTISLKVNIHDNAERYVNGISLSDKFEWGTDEYAWFQIEGIRGGTDGYCEQINGSDLDSEHPWWRLELLNEQNKTVPDIKEKLDKSKALNRYWQFRRSGGQPGIIVLSYGLISASIAELTDGILWSDDGAWDVQRFPTTSTDFLKWYFRPEKATTIDDADWSRECIDSIREELV